MISEFRVEKDGTLSPHPQLSAVQLKVLEAKLKVALARVQLMALEKSLEEIGEKQRPVRSWAVAEAPGAPEAHETSEAPAAKSTRGSRGSERVLLRIVEVAEMLAISRSKCYEMIQSGELPFIKLGRAIRVARADLDEWLAGIGRRG
jgi:excisionase family DNA binding protein